MKRRDFLRNAGAVALAPLLPRLGHAQSAGGATSKPAAVAPGSSGSKRPNIVFIAIDDLRWDALSCVGHPVARTPQIDRLAKEGMIFTNMFCSTPLCSPSRASYMTGQYAHRHGIVGNEGEKLRNFAHDDKLVTYAPMLKAAGYQTAHIGKWHMDPSDKPRPGFDHWVSFAGQGVYNHPDLNVNGQPVKKEGYITDILTDYAEEFIRQPHDRPYLLNVWHKAVHQPFTPADRHKGLYPGVEVPLAASTNDDLAGKPMLTSTADLARFQKAASLPVEKIALETLRTLAAIDESVGRLLKALSDVGQLDNTVVIFSADHGYFWGEHGLRDKRAAYEESIRMPMLVRYPKLIPAGTKSDALVMNIDMLPTFLDLAGAPPAKDIDGQSIVPLLKKPDAPGRQAFLTEYFKEARFPRIPDWQAVRTSEWKYIHYPTLSGMDELYNIREDKLEMHNRIAQATDAGTLATLQKQLADLLTKTRMPAELPAPVRGRA